MKSSTVGMVAAAILMAMAVAGFGIAQAGETYQAGEVMEQQTPQSATSQADDLQIRKPIETGKLPAKSNAGSYTVVFEGRTYTERVWKGDIDGH